MSQGEHTRHSPPHRVRELNEWRQDSAASRAFASKQREKQFLDAVEEILEPFVSRHQDMMRKEADLMEERFREHAAATATYVEQMSEQIRSLREETREVLKELRLSGEMSSAKIDRAAERLSSRYEETTDVAKSLNADARMLRAESHKIGKIKFDISSSINKHTKTILAGIKQINKSASTSNKNVVTGVNLIRRDVKAINSRKQEPVEPLATNRNLIVTAIALGSLICAFGLLQTL